MLQVDGQGQRRDAPQRQRHVQLVVTTPDQLTQERLVTVADGTVEGYQLTGKLLFT